MTEINKYSFFATHKFQKRIGNELQPYYFPNFIIYFTIVMFEFQSSLDNNKRILELSTFPL